MKTEIRNIIPVLLGADLNAYSVALAFQEAYGVRSHVFARCKSFETRNSKFITNHVKAGLDNPSVAIPALLKFADENNGAELFLIPCADCYVEMLETAGVSLGGIYNLFIPDTLIWRELSDKSTFYALMEKNKIPYPPFESIKYGDIPSREILEKFSYPAVIKPSNTSEYLRNCFFGMRKVYFPESYGECLETIEKIFDSGYRKNVIFQKKINDGKSLVLTTVSDSRGRVVRAVFGEVILEERDAAGIGNYSAIITRPLNALCFQLIEFLTKTGYKGIANFDIIATDKEEFVLELNTRQGRSCDYLRASGINIAELIVKSSKGEPVSADFSYKQIYWHHPSHATVMKYGNKEGVEIAQRLLKEGKEFSPYRNRYEGWKRGAHLFMRNSNLVSRFV